VFALWTPGVFYCTILTASGLRLRPVRGEESQLAGAQSGPFSPARRPGKYLFWAPGAPKTQYARSMCMSLPGSPSQRSISDVLSRLERFPRDRAELLPALDALNSEFGHLSSAAIESVAQHFGLPPSEVYGAATFYSMWNVGETPVEVVHLCEDGPCHVAGAAQVRRALERAGVEVRHTSCIGQCGHAPVAAAGSHVYRRVTLDTVSAILSGEEPTPLSPADEIIGVAVEDPTHSLARNIGKIDPRSLKEAVAAGHTGRCARRSQSRRSRW